MSEALVIGPRLRELEKVIEKGMASFVEVGNALLAIKQERRYKERGFKSFDDYVREHWNMGRAYAYRMIDAAKVVHEVSPIGDTSPATESQVRELAKADAPAEVWAEVVEQHPLTEITAKVIREHVQARIPAVTTVEMIEDAEILPGDPAWDLTPALDAIAEAVRIAKVAGATSQEMYEAYQRGIA